MGHCLDMLDPFLAKAAAGGEKDREFCMALFEYGHVTLTQALKMVPAGVNYPATPITTVVVRQLPESPNCR